MYNDYNYDYNYELTLVIEDTGNHQYQVDYSFTGPSGYSRDAYAIIFKASFAVET